MQKFVIAALAGLVVLAVVATATAQYPLPVLDFDAKLAPTKAGTKRKPKATKIRLDLEVPRESRVTADQITFNLPRHVRVNGGGFRFCPATELDATGDPAKCPRGSKVGSGTLTGASGPALTPLVFDMQLFVGSRNELGIWLAARETDTRKAVRGVVSRAGSPYFQKLTIDIPPDLQKHLGAVVYLTGLSATIGGSNQRRGRRRRELITTRGCPRDRKHRFEARVRFVPNPTNPPVGQAEQGDTAACTGRP